MKDLIKQHFRLLALALMFFATGTPKAYCQTMKGYFIYGSMLIQEAESSSNKITLHTNKDYFFWVAECGCNEVDALSESAYDVFRACHATGK